MPFCLQGSKTGKIAQKFRVKTNATLFYLNFALNRVLSRTIASCTDHVQIRRKNLEHGDQNFHIFI